MTRRLAGLQLAVLIATYLPAHAGLRDQFADTLYAPAVISVVAEYHGDTGGLSAVGRGKLLKARQTLIDFVASLQAESKDPFVYLEQDLRKKYPKRGDLFAGEFDGERILSIRVFDYEVGHGGRTLGFRYVTTEAAEGTVCEYQRSVVLNDRAGRWRIRKFGEFDSPVRE